MARSTVASRLKKSFILHPNLGRNISLGSPPRAALRIRGGDPILLAFLLAANEYIADCHAIGSLPVLHPLDAYLSRRKQRKG